MVSKQVYVWGLIFLASSSIPLLTSSFSSRLAASSSLKRRVYNERDSEFFARNESFLKSENTDTEENSSEAKEVSIGIGGKGGHVYDVNKFKRNLVQESMREYKHELLDLLANSSALLGDINKRRTSTSSSGNLISLPSLGELINTKLYSIISVNPVLSTTDSNLLDGKWELAYHASDAGCVLRRNEYMDSGATLLLENDINTSNPFRTITRSVHLEELSDEEDAFVVDTTRILNRFIACENKFSVIGLTRNSLILQLSNRRFSFFGTRWSDRKQKANKKGFQDIVIVEILYLDSDLCICERKIERVPESPVETSQLFVYTKNPKWTDSKERRRRKMRFFNSIPSWIMKLESPFQIRKRLLRSFPGLVSAPPVKVKQRQSVLFQKRSPTSQISVLTLGESGINREIDDEAVWDGIDDPFLHLDADERQTKLKSMSIKEIDAARLSQKQLNEKLKKDSITTLKKRKLVEPPTKKA